MGLLKTIIVWIVLMNIFSVGSLLLLAGLGVAPAQANFLSAGIGIIGGTLWVMR